MGNEQEALDTKPAKHVAKDVAHPMLVPLIGPTLDPPSPGNSCVGFADCVKTVSHLLQSPKFECLTCQALELRKGLSLLDTLVILVFPQIGGYLDR